MDASNQVKKTKIVCTLGPATDNDSVLCDMIDAGMDIARLNFSHGDHEEHGRRIEQIKRVRSERNIPLAIILDTSGPEIRLKKFTNGSAKIETGQTFILTTDDVEGDNARVSVSYADILTDVKPGMRILIDDGNAELRVEHVEGHDVVCTVVHGELLKDRKSVNLPDAPLSMPYVSDKDKSDLEFGISKGIDFVAASFVRTANDVLDIRRILEQNGGHNIKIIAKIENRQGVDNIDEILRVTDGVMVARGDMGVEIPFEELPHIQKMLIKKTYESGHMVITATQMLESMIENPRPTRAEITDVANAVYDGTSAVMLSGETTIGAYPALVVDTMSRIVRRTEADINYATSFGNNAAANQNITDAISHATVTTAHDLSAAAIITVTESGNTARMISKFRPGCPIIGCTPDEQTYRQLNLSWGVTPAMTERTEITDDLMENAVKCAVDTGIVKNGELVVLAAGVPVGISGSTNILKVVIVGDVLVCGKGNGVSAECHGNLCVCKNEEEALKNFKDGDILVIPYTTNKILAVLKRTRGIITEDAGLTSHAGIVGLTLEIPVITSACAATDILKSGTTVTIDSVHGLVYSGITRF
ncbi:MAG: pyruvate kinase [Clostridiales bacterium]|nr:pyruvate kinase [Clostridiales bacterium]